MKNHQKIVLAVLLLVFAVAKLSMLYWWQNQQLSVQTLQCEVAEMGCVFGKDDARFRLVGVVGQNTSFSAVAEGLPADTNEISVSFEMDDMEMGFNRFVLKKQEDGIWRAEQIRLPFCTAARHDWWAVWTIGGTTYRAAFETRF